MAGTNKFIKYATTAGGDGFDTYSDSDLVSLTKTGIPFGSIARTNILNGIMRQLTYTNKLWNDVISEKMTATTELNTSMSDSAYKTNIISAIGNIAKEVAVVKNTDITGATKTKITYDAKGLVTAGGDLTLSDLPSITQFTFLGRTADGSGAPSAITRDNLLGITANGLIRRTGTNTYSHYALVPDDIPTLAQSKITNLVDDLAAKVPTSRTIAGIQLNADISRTNLLGVTGTTSGLYRGTYNAGTGTFSYGLDNTSYAPFSSVALRDSASPYDPKFWVGTENDYQDLIDNDEIDPEVVYIVL